MKLMRIATLALCLQAPLTYNNNPQHDQCSSSSYFCCTILMAAGTLCATGAYIAHKTAKQNSVRSSSRDHSNNRNELNALKHICALSASGLYSCSMYCLQTCAGNPYLKTKGTQ